jgi:protein phosphatase
VRGKDWIVLCSDGLPTVLRDEQIGDILSTGIEPEGVCEELVKQTLDGGAPDNVTVIVLKFIDENSDNGSE